MPHDASTPVILPQTRYHRFFDSLSPAERARQAALNILNGSSEADGSLSMARSGSNSSISSAHCSPPTISNKLLDGKTSDEDDSFPTVESLCIDASNYITYAHSSSLNALCLTTHYSTQTLASAAGDGSVKIWRLPALSASKNADDDLQARPDLLHLLSDENEYAAFCLEQQDSTLYAGFQGGNIKVSCTSCQYCFTLSHQCIC